MPGKRQRDGDSQLSKNEYWANQNAPTSSSTSSFPRASDADLRNRKIVRPKPSAINDALHAATRDLNKRFLEHLLDQQGSIDSLRESWEPLIKDYITFARHLRTFYRRKGGVVLACGSNDCGQSGHGRDSDGAPIEPAEGLAVVKQLRNVDIRYVASGGIHSLAVSSSGRVFTCGCNDDGALGRPTKDGHLSKFQGAVTIGENSDLLCAKVQPEFDFHEVCWLQNASASSVPRSVSHPRVHVVQVAGGDCHSIALGLDGSVWTWGAYKDKDNKAFYNTGSADTCFGHTQYYPNLVDFSGLLGGDVMDSQRAVEIACGSSFNVARMRDGSVVTWGLGESGQLGRGKPPVLRPDPTSRNYDTRAAHEHHLTPQRVSVPGSEAIHAIGCGSYHTLLCSRDAVWSFGLNNYGQLGVDPDDEKHPFASAAKATENNHEGSVMRVLVAPSPVKVAGLESESVGIICSVDGGEHHSLELGMSGAVYSFGRGDAGELGWKKADDNRGFVSSGYFCHKPKRVEGPLRGYAIKQINCGSHHNIAVAFRGEVVFAWCVSFVSNIITLRFPEFVVSPKSFLPPPLLCLITTSLSHVNDFFLLF